MLTDLRKKLKPLYTASAKKAAIIDIPSLQCLSIDGKGAPESDQFKRSIEALYGAVYTLKFGLKKSTRGKLDFNIMPLEGFYTMANGAIGQPGPREQWEWKLLIVVPEWVTNDQLKSAVGQLKSKKDNPCIGSLRLERVQEGKVVQMLHIGPYVTEPETVNTMLRFAEAEGYACAGGHHEIYMSDPHRTDQSKLKTILRHSVRSHRAKAAATKGA